MALKTSQRQILVNTGNRYVVFGPDHGLPQDRKFDQQSDTRLLPRVADESDVAHERIIKHIKIDGMNIVTEMKDAETGRRIDIVAQDEEGRKHYIEVKAKERDPKRPDLELAQKYLNDFKDRDVYAEVWFFNIERLKLLIMSNGGAEFNELVPIDVWSRSNDGIFDRNKVVSEVDDWVSRLKELFEEIKLKIGSMPGLRIDESRSVVMSEELMQQFSVTDRELPILDVIKDEEAIASFVPRGLWLVGAWGRVDLITRRQTVIIIAIKEEGAYSWRFSTASDKRRTKVFNLDLLSDLIGAA